jgi:hypothetical protein
MSSKVLVLLLLLSLFHRVEPFALSSATRQTITTRRTTVIRHGREDEDIDDVNRRGVLSRRLFGAVLRAVATTLPSVYVSTIAPAGATGEGSERMVLRHKPTAVTSALVPAVEQRLLLQVIIAELSSSSSSSSSLSSTVSPSSIEKIKSILPPLNEDRIPDYRVMQQYSPSKVLMGSLTRAAMNLYTSNLNYGISKSSSSSSSRQNQSPTEYYTITDPAWRRDYIRANDGLPTVDQVVAADLDVRDLYRNQVQQRLDDASAELYSRECDVEELQSVVVDAAKSFDMWLDRISDEDVADAIQAALASTKNGRKEVTVHEPYRAGFVVPSAPRWPTNDVGR